MKIKQNKTTQKQYKVNDRELHNKLTGKELLTVRYAGGSAQSRASFGIESSHLKISYLKEHHVGQGLKCIEKACILPPN